MAHIQILVLRGGGLQQGFQCCVADGFNKSLVLSVVQADVSLHTAEKRFRLLSLHPEFKKYRK